LFMVFSFFTGRITLFSFPLNPEKNSEETNPLREDYF